MHKLIHLFPLIILSKSDKELRGFLKTCESDKTIFAMQLGKPERGVFRFDKRVWKVRLA